MDKKLIHLHLKQETFDNGIEGTAAKFSRMSHTFWHIANTKILTQKRSYKRAKLLATLSILHQYQIF